MGPDRARVQAEALRIAQKSHHFFTALQHESMPIPVADRLLRLCGVPRLNYLARVGLLGEYEDALLFFDEKVSDAAQAQAGLPPDPTAATSQQSAPLRNAGFAFRTYHNDISLFSSLGAFSQAAPHILRICPQGLPPTFAASIQTTLQLVRERVGPDALSSLPPDNLPDTALHFYSTTTFTKLQRLLSSSAANRAAALSLQTSSPAEAARYFASSSPCASSWLADPFSVDPMPDEVHAAACKLRRNQPLCPTAPTTCYCGTDLSNDPWHVLSHKGGPEALRRHDACVNVLEDWVHRAGGQAFVEPRQDFWEDRRRPDLRVVLGAQSYLIDVRITHPTAACWVPHACQGPLRATIPASNQKRRRFDALAAAEGSVFIPFILETYGGFADEARTFINTIARFANSHSHVWTASQARLGMRSALHKELFRGNLRVAHAVLQRCNPMRYASGRLRCTAPRPPTYSTREDVDSDDDTPSPPTAPATSTLPTTTSATSTYSTTSLTNPTASEQPLTRTPPPTLLPHHNDSISHALPPTDLPALNSSPLLPPSSPLPTPPQYPQTSSTSNRRSRRERTQTDQSFSSVSPPRGRSRTARPFSLRSSTTPSSIGTLNFISHATQASLLALVHYGTQTQILSRNGSSAMNHFTTHPETRSNPINDSLMQNEEPLETLCLRSSNTSDRRSRSER